MPDHTKPAVLLVVALTTYFFLSEAAGPQQAPFFPSPPPAVGGLQPLTDVAAEVFNLTNAARRQHGLPPLAKDEALAAAARAHSVDMLARGFFSHVNPDGLSPSQRLPLGYAQALKRSGENIWMGSGLGPADRARLARMIVAGLLASPGHRENILSPHYTHLGVGVAAWGREIRATQVFGQISPQVR